LTGFAGEGDRGEDRPDESPSEPQRLRVGEAELGQRQRARFRRELGEASDRLVDAERRLVAEGGVGALRRRTQRGVRGRRPVLADGAMALTRR
jgi:hypothetical protein